MDMIDLALRRGRKKVIDEYTANFKAQYHHYIVVYHQYPCNTFIVTVHDR